MLQKTWLNFLRTLLNSSYRRKLVAQCVPPSVTMLYFCHIKAKNVHHFVISVCKAENYLPKLLRFMHLITSYLLHYLPYLRININSLIYGKNVRSLTEACYHFLDFHLMLSIPSFFHTFFMTEAVGFSNLWNYSSILSFVLLNSRYKLYNSLWSSKPTNEISITVVGISI